jgi:hypothetical protein
MERRFGHRITTDMFLNEYVRDRLHRCVATNVSETGLHLQKLITPPQRRQGAVQLEFELPGTGELIWARGEVAYEERDPYFHSTGVRLTGIARRHARLLSDYVRERRAAHLRGLLERIRKNRIPLTGSLH